jgi:hypothetical protein
MDQSYSKRCSKTHVNFQCLEDRETGYVSVRGAGRAHHANTPIIPNSVISDGLSQVIHIPSLSS